ncbi:putative zinc ribbon domain protein [Enhygromyxa salina]|uniref:Putative zinc ribbon domain protein n=1 Tax=Enhygromyxa salina TaxID=215803 RepID=A0A2S9XSM0_9BACT|nr:C4-type zinc ribbon domain-containing protein [Enhygromyxa salina]PRP95862.1 putative zinc ribbon domain protein [Enhygromyxa salina]
MKDQIEALHRLQTQDRRLVSIERKLGAIPRRKQEMERDLEKLEAMLQTELDKLDTSRSFRMDQERQLEEEREQIRSSRTRISQVKTPRELNAAQRELDSTRRLADKRQTEIGGIDEAIAEAEARIKAMEGGLSDLRESVRAELERLEKIEAKLTRSYKKARRNRGSLTEKIDKPHLRRYERVRKRGGGIGFVAVRDRRCTACKMAVAHQTYVALRNAEIIALCESCGRMLYWGGLFPDEDKPEETKPKAAPSAGE